MTPTEQIATDLMLGRLTPRQAGQALGNPCPDEWDHALKYRASETTWRKTPEQIAADWSVSCGWCGGNLDSGKESQS